jgi:DNA repair photolyase
VFVRWSSQTLENEQRARLPGYRDEAVVRHFDAPEAISTNFYEIRAKTIINRVPEASRMPFRWTINPYRGCSHACTYCLSGDTRVLCADGRERPLRDLELGHRIVGTRVDGRYRRLVETEVFDKWSSIKRAYLVALDDGTQLIASGDHRFLSRRGWKHVTGMEQGAGRRPHLTVGSILLGPGGSVAPPQHGVEFRRGYLCGMVRGDGTPGHYPYDRPGRNVGDLDRFRLALADFEALARSRLFLSLEGVATDEFSFATAAGARRSTTTIRNQARHAFERISELIAFPRLPTLAWIKGFLSGIFDAEGSHSQGVLRISNADEEILAWIRAGLRRLGFQHVTETQLGRRVQCVRLRGGMSARMRFILSVDPAISRKRTFAGLAVKNPASLRVEQIADLGEVQRMYDITTGTGDFIANGAVSHNCFARPTHTYLDFDAGRDFEREIVVKVNAPERLRVELARPSWKHESIALGTNTDPYQWVEGRYKLTRGIWEVMIEARNPGSVLTKSPLLLRDLDLMKELNRRAGFAAALSIPTMDERAWRSTEPHTPNPRARMEAVAELTRAGIRTGVLVAPLMPGINDAPEQVAEILELASEAGAVYVSGIALHLRGETRQVFMDWLAENRPDLIERYRELYKRGAYAPPAERQRLARLVKVHDVEPWRRGEGAEAEPPREVSVTGHTPVQESLFDAETGRSSRW